MKCGWFVKGNLTACLLGLFLMLFPSSAWANGGAVSVSPKATGKLEFEQDPGIRLKEEKIRIRLSDVRRWAWTRAEVEAEYVIENIRGEAMSKEFVFLAPGPSPVRKEDMEAHLNRLKESYRFQVRVNGKPAEIEWHGTVQPGPWREGGTRIVDPLDGRVYEHHGAKYPVMAIQFRAEILPKGTPTRIRVGYKDAGGFYGGKAVVNEVFGFTYMLTPARRWAGKAPVYLEVTVPAGCAFRSNLPMKRVADNRYEATLQGIPSKDWEISVVSARGLIFGTNQAWLHTPLSFLLLFALAAGILLSGHRRGALWIRMLAYPVAVGIHYALIRKFFGYPLDVFLIPVSCVLVLTLVFVIDRVAGKRTGKGSAEKKGHAQANG